MASSLSKILSSSGAKRVYFILALALLLVLLCDNIVMPWFVNRGGVVDVPNVVGLKFGRAEAVIDSVGLEAKLSDVRSDLQYPAGTVISQSPNAGSKVRSGRRVYLLISGGEPVAEVPSLKGRSLRDAKFALERVGLALGETSYQPSEDFPPNTIIDQGILPETRVKKGTLVSVVISQGKETDRIAVPQVVGKILPEAEKLLNQRGLQVGNITYQENLELLPNTVLDQYPRSGELVGLGQPVDLFVVQTGAKRPREFMEN